MMIINTTRKTGSDPVSLAHPAERPAEPDHPMMLDGHMVPGDVELMIRCMIEELLLLGTSFEDLCAMTREPNYQALYAARCEMGDERMDAVLARTYQRVGRHHHADREHHGDVQPATLTIGRTG
jgi:hypothetical protein